MITGMSETKSLVKHASCGCKCRFDGKKCNANQKCNKPKCLWECKRSLKNMCVKKFCSWIPSVFNSECGKICEIDEYLNNSKHDIPVQKFKV